MEQVAARPVAVALARVAARPVVAAVVVPAVAGVPTAETALAVPVAPSVVSAEVPVAPVPFVVTVLLPRSRRRTSEASR